jgi:hypothetical protein
MATSQTPRPRQPDNALAPRGPLARVSHYFRTRVDPLTSLFLVLPLFLVYQLGVLARMQCGPAGCNWQGNGVDFLTANLLEATQGSLATFAAIAVGVTVVLAGAILWARRRARLHPRLFVPVVLESALYASLVGPAVAATQHAVGLGARASRDFVGNVVSSFGAGLHEELVFRAGLFAGGAFALRKLGMKPLTATLVAAAVSAVLFSAVHHLGALGEPFTVGAFVFRILAGLAFTLVYRVRGFAIAAWTHALYDVWVFTLHS